jgi:hypothetical protein
MNQSRFARLSVWLAATWLFLVVTGIDHFHTHHDLIDHEGCTTECCQGEFLACDGHRISSSFDSPLGLHEPSTDCAACRLWSAFTSSDFVKPLVEHHDDLVSRFISTATARGPVATQQVCFGRSPPVLS